MRDDHEPRPVSPVLTDGTGLDFEVEYGVGQPQYRVLPALKVSDGRLLSRWHMGFWARVRVLFLGDVYLSVLTFNKPLQPVKVTTVPPREIAEAVRPKKKELEFEESLGQISVA